MYKPCFLFLLHKSYYYLTGLLLFIFYLTGLLLLIVIMLSFIIGGYMQELYLELFCI